MKNKAVGGVSEMQSWIRGGARQGGARSKECQGACLLVWGGTQQTKKEEQLRARTVLQYGI